MSQLYRYEIELFPYDQGSELDESAVDKIIRCIPYDINDHAVLSGTAGATLVLSGEDNISGGLDADQRHAEVVAGIEAAGWRFDSIVTRWRCLEYDTWDDVVGEDEDACEDHE